MSLDSVYSRSTSLRKYIREAVKNVEYYLRKECGGEKLAKRTTVQFPRESITEMYMSIVLDVRKANYYQLHMGVLR